MRRQHEQVAEEFGAWQTLAVGQAAVVVPRGQTLYTPTTAAGELFLLTKGQVSLYLMETDRPLTLRVAGPGQLFGHVAVAGDAHYDSFAETLTQAQLYQIDRSALAERLQHDGKLALALLEDLGEHRLTVSRRLDEVAFKSVPARLASVLLDMAPQPDGSQLTRVPRHSHRQLAEMINAYRETVTKVINQFVAARVLEIDRYTITLINRSRLEELAQGW